MDMISRGLVCVLISAPHFQRWIPLTDKKVLCTNSAL